MFLENVHNQLTQIQLPLRIATFVAVIFFWLRVFEIYLLETVFRDEAMFQWWHSYNRFTFPTIREFFTIGTMERKVNLLSQFSKINKFERETDLFI